MSDGPVLIAGGGPAGLAAAIVLAEAEVPTILCEKQDYPVDKVCGEGIMPTGVAHLRDLGVARALERCSFPFLGIRYHAGPEIKAAAAFAEGPGWGVRRTTLSRALYRRASQLPTLDLRMGVIARPLGYDSGRIVIAVGGKQVTARLLIGADGLNSGVRRWAQLNGPAPRWQRWGARRHFHLRPWSDHVDVHWSAQGVEAYVTPTGPEEVGVALLWHNDRYRVEGGSDLFASLLAPFPDLQARLAGAEATDEVAATGPLHRPVTDVIADGVLLIGDAAGYLDAITGEGISLALAEARSLEKTVLPVLHQKVPIGRDALQLYRQRFQTIVRSYYHFTRVVLFFSDHPALVPPVIRLLGRWPGLFRTVLSASMGTIR